MARPAVAGMPRGLAAHLGGTAQACVHSVPHCRRRMCPMLYQHLVREPRRAANGRPTQPTGAAFKLTRRSRTDRLHAGMHGQRQHGVVSRHVRHSSRSDHADPRASWHRLQRRLLPTVRSRRHAEPSQPPSWCWRARQLTTARLRGHDTRVCMQAFAGALRRGRSDQRRGSAGRLSARCPL